MCYNRQDIERINEIKNGVFYCMNKNSMVSYECDCRKCKELMEKTKVVVKVE